MARILWHSAAPWCASGYGQQTAQVTRRLAAAGHDIHVSAHYGLEGTRLAWNGITVHPGANDFGDRMLPRYIERLKPDLVVTLLDVWVLDGKPLRGCPVASWVPVDHEPIGASLSRFFDRSDAVPVAMSRHGEAQLAGAGLDPVYVPHAIDTTVFRPGDRAAARRRLELPEDAFLIGMVAANMDHSPSRKAWPEALRAYKRFRDRHPEALLYAHTDLTGQSGGGVGVNIPWLCDRIGLDPEDLRGTPQLAYETGGAGQEMLAAIYNAVDVLLAPSYGEGFGITVVEAQACGTPVIVSDFSAQPELCGAGWTVAGEPWWVDRYRAWWQQPSVDGIVDALEQAYAHARDEQLRARAVAFAADYDADRVFDEHWRPALDRILPAMPAAAAPNRAQRRALAKAGATA